MKGKFKVEMKLMRYGVLHVWVLILTRAFSSHVHPGLSDFVCLHGCFAAPRQWLRAIHGQWPDQDWKLGI